MASATEKKFCTVNGLKMAYAEMGDATAGQTLLFLHGNPTFSYLWRNVVSPLVGRGRLIAPDLIGMGDSDKLSDSGPGSYAFEVHSDFVDKMLNDCLELTDNVVLILHDWGSALGFHWARRFPERVKGIAYMEALVRPMQATVDFDPDFQSFFAAVRTPDVGESMIIEDNAFIEQVLPSSVLRNLTESEMNVYRAPYLDGGETRRPLLDWAREVPLDGEPENVQDIVAIYAEWLVTSDHPKLLVVADPGLLLTGSMLETARTFENQKEVTVPGLHFVQEDSPEEVARAIEEWLDGDSFVDATSPTDAPTSGASFPEGGVHLWFILLAAVIRSVW